MYCTRSNHSGASTISKASSKKIACINRNKGNPAVNMVEFIMICMMVHIKVYCSVGDATLFNDIPGTSLFVSLYISLFTSSSAALFGGVYTVIFGGLFFVIWIVISKAIVLDGLGGAIRTTCSNENRCNGMYYIGNIVYGLCDVDIWCIV